MYVERTKHVNDGEERSDFSHDFLQSAQAAGKNYR